MKTKQQKREEALVRMEHAYENGFNHNPKRSSLKHIQNLRAKLGMPAYEGAQG